MDEGSYTETGIPKEVMGPIDNWVTGKSLCGCTGKPTPSSLGVLAGAM